MGRERNAPGTPALMRGASHTDAPLVDPTVEWAAAARVPGSAARERLLVGHTGLVKYLAHRIGSRLAGPVDFDDLVGDGILGLMEAIDRFDPSHGVQFKTYAEARIRGAILDGVRCRDWAPRSLRRAARRLETAIVAVEHRTRRPAEDEEIASELGLSVDELHALYQQARGVRLGHMPAGEDEGNDPADPGASPLFAIQEKERREVLAQEIDHLPERERMVLSLYYERGLTLKEIGAVLDVTESRVCQIHTRAISRLRARVGERLTVPLEEALR
ncbi:MAG: FliA/WhiG family RNA polymerase sigma factor [Acidobacteria bacterium]|nr:FliA/WhiG family RNA polymerase sigma factor [Acidobacteriota bacterium]